VGALRHAGCKFVPVACSNSTNLLVVHVSSQRTFGWRRHTWKRHPSSSNCRWTLRNTRLSESSFRESFPIFLSSRRVSVIKAIKKTHVCVFYATKCKRPYFPFNSLLPYQYNTAHTYCTTCWLRICIPTRDCSDIRTFQILHRYHLLITL
jgi:hypothetical protein